MGVARLHLGEPGLARPLFRTVIDLDPAAPAAHYLLALSYRDEEDLTRFQEQLERVLDLNPGHQWAKINLAKTLARQGETAAGKALLDGLGDDAAQNVEVLELRGAIALLEGRKADAVAEFTKAVEQEPSSHLTLKLSFSQRQAGDLDGSVTTLEGWLEDHPADIDVRLTLANGFLASKDLGSARRHYAKIILLVPNHVVVLNNLAWVHARLGDPGAALPYAERAYTLASSDTRIMDTLGSILTELGDTERAVDLLRRAAKRQSGNPEIQGHLARALARHGNVSEARDVLRQVLSDPREFTDRQEAESLLIELGG
jgi:tetratricopeptide (TPR) repeat protein